MSNIRPFQFSCALFLGYRAHIDLDLCDTLDDIINSATQNLRNFLKSNNLEVLCEKLDNFHYHIHDTTFVDILMSTPTPGKVEFYICGQCS